MREIRAIQTRPYRIVQLVSIRETDEVCIEQEVTTQDAAPSGTGNCRPVWHHGCVRCHPRHHGDRTGGLRLFRATAVPGCGYRAYESAIDRWPLAVAHHGRGPRDDDDAGYVRCHSDWGLRRRGSMRIPAKEIHTASPDLQPGNDRPDCFYGQR